MSRGKHPMEFGVIGLGKMGSNFCLHAAQKGMRVVGYSQKIRNEQQLRSGKIEIADDLKSLVGSLSLRPRKIFLYVPAGPVVDLVIKSLVPLLSSGDVIVDAGNSHFRDSAVRHDQVREIGIGFVDCGSSGGPSGALTGGCFMVGGDEKDVKIIEPILKALAVEDGYIHAGPPGAGHFVKLVHNGIEFGMLQAIGEGVSLLKASAYEIDLPSLFHSWANGSVIRGWLVELMEKGLRENPDLNRIPSYIEDTGEVNWLLEEAVRSEISIPVMMQSVMELFSSRDDKQVSRRSVSILRHEFGEHPFGKDAEIAMERKVGHVGVSSKKSKGKAA